MLQDVGRHLVDVADEVGGAQVSAAVLIGQVLQDLLSAEVEAGAEHLLAVLCRIASLLAWKERRWLDHHIIFTRLGYTAPDQPVGFGFLFEQKMFCG
jgi:hypothetical protein